MSDDLFSQLFELFNAPGPVNWKLGAEVAKQLGGEAEPLDPWITEEYQDLVRLAQLQLDATTALSPDSAADLRPMDRRSWIEANLKSYGYLVADVTTPQLADDDPMAMFIKPMMPAMLGLQMGSFVGFLGHSALGSFDVGFPSEEQSALQLIVPNVEAFATDHGLDRRQVRLWAAVREVAHKAFSDLEWLRPELRRRAGDYANGIGLDLSSLMERFQSISDPTEIQRMMEDPVGLTGMLAPDEQRAALGDLHALVVVMAGYVEHLLDTMGANLLPDLGRIRSAHHLRRSEPAGNDQMLDRLIGIEISADAYELGRVFIQEVNARWGPETPELLLTGPQMIPDMAEVRDPVAWAARVLLPEL